MDTVARLTLYTDLMEEIKRRHTVIDAGASGRLAALLPPRPTEEFCYLQLRMMCELIALASLVVHGDIDATQTGKIKKRYEADWIMNVLTKVHPNFYPRPSRQILDSSGKPTRVEPITTGYLTKDELIRLYHECGGILHRGTLGDVSARKTRPVDFKRIADWMGKMVTLLNHHQIAELVLVVWTGGSGFKVYSGC